MSEERLTVAPDPRRLPRTVRHVTVEAWTDFLLGAASDLTGTATSRIIEAAVAPQLLEVEAAIVKAAGVEGLEEAWRRYLRARERRR